MAIPIYTRNVQAAKEAVLREDLQVMRTAIGSYTVDKQKAPQSLDDLVTGGLPEGHPQRPRHGPHRHLDHRAVGHALAPSTRPMGGIDDVHSGAQDDRDRRQLLQHLVSAPTGGHAPIAAAHSPSLLPGPVRTKSNKMAHTTSNRVRGCVRSQAARPLRRNPMRPGTHFALATLLAAALLASGASAQQPAPASTTPATTPSATTPADSTATAPAATAPAATQPASQAGTPAASTQPAAAPTQPSANSSDRPAFGVPNDTSAKTGGQAGHRIRHLQQAAGRQERRHRQDRCRFPRPARTSTRTSRRAARTTWTPLARATSAGAAWATGTPPTGRSRPASSTPWRSRSPPTSSPTRWWWSTSTASVRTS